MKLKVILSLIICLILSSCSSEQGKMFTSVGGALGTTYTIKYYSDTQIEKEAFDSIFDNINASMSLYAPDSDINKINAGDSTIRVDSLFATVLHYSKIINKQTEGWFDPTVGQLVAAWGFGAEQINPRDKVNIDSLMQFVGLDKVTLNPDNTIYKAVKGVKLDFNAIAKGYTVDLVGMMLEKKGVKNYLVEIGGETRSRGLKDDGSQWLVGIEDPVLSAQDRVYDLVLKVNDESMASSGNYRKYRIGSDGMRYVHTINPRTGMAIQSDVLMATVVASDCLTADAYATALMAMGYTNAREQLSRTKQIKAILVYVDSLNVQHTYIDPRLEKNIHR